MSVSMLRAGAVPALVLALLPGLAAGAEEEREEGKNVIQQGSTIGIEYTLKLDDGQVVDTNVGGDALVFEQGAGNILPAVDAAVVGMEVGSEKELTIPPEEAYGPVQQELFQTVPLEDVPENARQEGTPLLARDAQGNERPLRVHEVHEETIVLDLNHPLAGETLHFEIKVVSVE
jgi:FKBP-type peptidyl-prolyl cis-trans isomerase 2